MTTTVETARSPAPRRCRRRFAASRSRRRSLMTADSVNQPRILTSAGTVPRQRLRARALSAVRGRRRPGSSSAVLSSASSPEASSSSTACGDAGGERRVLWPAARPTRRRRERRTGRPRSRSGPGRRSGRAPSAGRRRRVDLFVLQRRDDVVGAVEDFRLAARARSLLRPRRGWWCRSGRRSWRPSGRRAMSPSRRRSPSARRPPGWRCSRAPRSRPPFRAPA